MQRSAAIQLSGDLRPIWIVSGRIRNNSPAEISSVTIEINIVPRTDPLPVDSATLVIETDLPPDAVGSFSREIHILPPKGGWDFTYSVTKALPK
jgi:hypothetical protein